MKMPWGVLAVYGALGIWFLLLVFGMRRRAYGSFLGFGIAFLLLLNIRYFIEGAPAAISFFIGIYDVLDNLGVAASHGAAALAPCPDNACTVWGDRYLLHPSWGVAFHDRFLNGPAFRTGLLYAHLGFNSVVFVLMHIQLLRPGTGSHSVSHRVLGRVSFVCLTVGTICAIWLASEHGPVGEYGGSLSMVGFWFMSLCVYGCAVMGVLAIRQGDTTSHRIWMIRFAGSMWGAFWLFRVMLFVGGPQLRNHEAANLLMCIWLSAPLGILIAELFRRRSDQRASAGQKPLDARQVTAEA
jgi:hypothetical protein